MLARLLDYEMPLAVSWDYITRRHSLSALSIHVLAQSALENVILRIGIRISIVTRLNDARPMSTLHSLLASINATRKI